MHQNVIVYLFFKIFYFTASSYLFSDKKKTMFMASDPITSWEIDGETVETMSDFIFLGSKITLDGDCIMKLKDAYSLEGKL